jgi:type 1 glutamine amidotransferase
MYWRMLMKIAISHLPTLRWGIIPVIWSNPRVKARNVYFLIGHSGSLFASADFTTMFSNAIHWSHRKVDSKSEAVPNFSIETASLFLFLVARRGIEPLFQE